MNRIKPTEKDYPLKKQRNILARAISWVISGTILTRDKVVNQLPFLILLVIFSMIYIGNIYNTETLIRTFNSLERENKELYYKYIVMKSRLTEEFSRQSEVAKKLAGTGVMESTIPPHKIFDHD